MHTLSIYWHNCDQLAGMINGFTSKPTTIVRKLVVGISDCDDLSAGEIHEEKFTAGIHKFALAYIPAALVGDLLPSRLGVLADGYGRKPLMVASMDVVAVGSFVIPELNNLVALSALWGLQALSFAAGDPAEQALVSDITGSDQRGRGYGIYLMAAGIGATVGPLVGGWLYKNIYIEAPFYLNGIVLTISLVILSVCMKEPQAA